MLRYAPSLTISVVGILFRAGTASGADPSDPAPTAVIAPQPLPSPREVPRLTLDQVERAAIEHQPQIVAARASTHVAEGQAEVAKSPLLPQVVGTASYTRETGNFAMKPGVTTAPAQSVGGSLFSKTYDYWNFGVNATQLIYDFGQTADKYRAASLNVDAVHDSEQTTKLNVLLNVRRAYFAARANKELVDVAKETLDDQNKHLVQVQGMVRAGTQPPIALAQQKAAVANATVQWITAQNNYETSKASLNQAAGMAAGTEYDVTDQDVGAVPDEDQPLETLVGKALTARPELSALIRQRQAAEATLSSARGTYGPSIAASAGVTEVGVDLEQLVPNWNAGVGVTWPIFQGGLTKGLVHQAEAGLESVDAQKSIEELQVRLDVDSARLAVRAAKATIGAVDDALASAREQLRLAEQRYATGVGSIIELNDAQVTFTTAAAQVVSARYGLATARAQLLAALGRT